MALDYGDSVTLWPLRGRWWTLSSSSNLLSWPSVPVICLFALRSSTDKRKIFTIWPFREKVFQSLVYGSALNMFLQTISKPKGYSLVSYKCENTLKSPGLSWNHVTFPLQCIHDCLSIKITSILFALNLQIKLMTQENVQWLFCVPTWQGCAQGLSSKTSRLVFESSQCRQLRRGMGIDLVRIQSE